MQNIFGNEIINAKPFLKWAGGKNQLLKEFDQRLPKHVKKKKTVDSYIEPFVGGGAMFFFMKSSYNVKKSFIFDVNRELILAYQTIKADYKNLIDKLLEIEDKHLSYSEDRRKEHYYAIRDEYNDQMVSFDFENYNEGWIDRVTYLIFLNKTCFNGLFRQNQKGQFNVPYGRYKNPKIYNKKNIIEVNKALKDTKIFCADFNESKKFIEENSLVYLDPPYRPISKTSNFTTYAKNGFNDEDQKRLANFFHEMNNRGAYLMLSNSDPKNEDPEDSFFDDLYKEFKIERVPAKRHINCDASKRGEINELIIRNYWIGA